MKKKVFIVGVGQIGTAIKELETEAKNKVYTYDIIKQPELPSETLFDVIHICIPFGKKFVRDVSTLLKRYVSDIVIIHSTVDIGTTQKIKDATGVFDIVHSPVVGVHPNLKEGILTFDKVIGADTAFASIIASRHLKSLGIKTKSFVGTKDSEAAKLLSTTYYGMNIIYMKEVKKLCDKHNLNFDDVYTFWNNNYNTGYKKLNMDNVVRPVLNFMPGKIGGHCVVPNFKILKNKFKLAKIFNKFNNKY